MGRKSPIVDELHEAMKAFGPEGATIKQLAEALAGKAGEWAIGKQAGKLSQTGRATRTWEYYEVEGLKGPIGRWRYFAA